MSNDPRFSPMILAYGAPAVPESEPGQHQPRPQVLPDDWRKFYEVINPKAAQRHRVSVTQEADGTMRLKITDVSGKLLFETGGRGTITVEFDL